MRSCESVLKHPRLVLASASPRRANLLSQIGLSFEVYPSDIAESRVGEHAPEVTQNLALRKAAAVSHCFEEAIVIGADTLVSFDGELLGKPADADAAVEMLARLSGSCHEVVTGVALVDAGTGREVIWSETTQVYFRALRRAEITAYIATGEAADKAGAYGIQGRGAAFVRRVEGCYFNVVGLPLASLVEHLSHFQPNAHI